MKNIAGSNYRIIERKSSKFGTPGYVSRGTELFKKWDGKEQAYYDNLKREDIYKTALDLYVHDQLARPIIDLIVNAIFNRPPDFQGDKILVERASQVARDSEIDWHKLGADLEVHGDLFLRAFLGKDAKLASLPPETIKAEYASNNVLDITKYLQFPEESYEKSIPASEISHVKIHCTSNMVYGESTLRPVFWWFDVLDNLWERNWIRAAQYYGSPIVVVTGIPGNYQSTVETSLEKEGQRPGRSWMFPENVNVDTLDFTKNYPIQELVDRVYQYILAACGIPQHLIFESGSSRGVAMFSGDAFEMMINNRRHIWALGLIKALRIIFESEGIWKDDSKFRIGWTPLFQRDLKDLASVITVAMENGIFSKRTAREKLGADHSEEVERLKKQEEEEPKDEPKISVVSPPVEPAPKVTPNK